MKAVYDLAMTRHYSQPGCGREHPWTVSTTQPDARYYDFKANPDLIETCLEDFRPWDHYDAIKGFYRFLRWLSSGESVLESNESWFRPPTQNNIPDYAKQLRCLVQVGIFMRNLRFNTLENHYYSFRDMLLHKARQIKPDFQNGEMRFADMSTYFTGLQVQAEEEGFGCICVIQCLAYGDTEEETMQNLEVVVSTLYEACRDVSDTIKGSNAT